MTSDTRQFAVLLHTGVDSPHFDLMIETAPGGSLATWRTDRWPWPPDEEMELSRLKDHRRIYLTFEGPIGGERGGVHRVASGVCQVDEGGTRWVVRLPESGDELLLKPDRHRWPR